MSWFVFSLMLLVGGVLPAWAIDSAQVDTAAVVARHTNRKGWGRLVPTHVIGQNAGNMGIFSIGAGWDYGKRKQWETSLMAGLVPKGKSSAARMTLTLKQNYMPWRISCGRQMQVVPLTMGFYVNAILGGEFWNHQPSRYPNNYYWFSTRFRTNLCVGQRITHSANFLHLRFIDSLSVFYEVSSCDLYLIEFFTNRSISLKNMAGLSVGFKIQLR